MTSIGNPIIGDPVYGGHRAGRIPEWGKSFAPTGFLRQALHAFLIGFRHPETGEAIRFFSQLPGDYKKLIRFLEEM
jgi:23S rRNA pseudouridine1911/1915/1917 synthase